MDLSGLLAAELPDAGHRGRFPGAVGLIARDGEVVDATAVGEAVRYADDRGTLAADRVPVAADTIYDLASVTKLFTTVVLLRLVAGGRLTLDTPVAEVLGEYADRAAVTLRHLLTHTAGLPASRAVTDEAPGAPAAEHWRLALTAPLLTEPGARHVYSDLGLIAAGRVAEEVAGTPLDALVRVHVTGPLGMADTAYRPPSAARRRIAATEYQPGRGMVRGVVHDETAYALGGVCGHAGLFGTAADLLRFGEALRTGALVDPALLTSVRLPTERFTQGVGVRIESAGPLRGAFGHTGFTGTSLLVDPARRLTVVLLTNRVHPSRAWSDVVPVRSAVAALAASYAVGA